MKYRTMRNQEDICGCCGKRTYSFLDDHFPECSAGCAEWVVDRNIERDHGIWNDDER